MIKFEEHRAHVVAHNLMSAAYGLKNHTSKPQNLWDSMYMSIIMDDIHSYSQVITRLFTQRH